jgi:hypothetical protein
MMKEYDLDQPVEFFGRREQPHFDDSRAALSAQPVVPLVTIDATVKKRRRLFVVGAFVLAMVLGAVSALIASYVKLRNAPVTAAAGTEPPVEPEPVVVAEPVPSESPAGEESLAAAQEEGVAQDDIQTPEVFVAPVEEPKRISARRRNADVVRERRESSGDEDGELERMRDAMLYDEWQERRARRVLRRERRRAERDNSRDLSNLDEIFEGRRRRRP